MNDIRRTYGSAKLRKDKEENTKARALEA